MAKLPDGYYYGLMFTTASRKQLDDYGATMELPRRKFEPDFLYKRRLTREAVRRYAE